jgi:hypothetical protein
MHDMGPSPTAFHFKTAFDADDRLIVADPDTVRRKIQLNNMRHAPAV